MCLWGWVPDFLLIEKKKEHQQLDYQHLAHVGTKQKAMVSCGHQKVVQQMRNAGYLGSPGV